LTFRGRLRLFFAIIVVVPLIAIGAVLFSLTSDSERGKVDAGLSQGLQVALVDYSDASTEARDDLLQVAADPVLRSALARGHDPAAATRLRELVAADRRITGAALFDADGRTIARTGSRGAFAPATVPLKREDGAEIGTLAVSLTTARELVRSAARSTGLSFIASRDGKALASSIPAVKDVPSGSAFFRAGGEDFRGRAQTVGELNGQTEEIAVFQEASDLNSAITDRRALIAAILLAFLLLSLASSVFVVRALQGQVGEFLVAARRLAGGDFESRVQTEGHDEFAALGREFNSMAEQLQGKINELERKREELEETIRRVGRAFATGLDRQGTFELTVQTAVDACEADTGHAHPLDLTVFRAVRAGETDDELLAALEAAERQAFAISPDTGEELLEAPDTTAAAPTQRGPVVLELDGVHALALPLRARLGTRAYAQQVGVVSIARRGKPFSPQQEELLEYLGGQAVISIENADLHDTVQRQAITDELTGLSNIRELHGTLDREFERRRRFETPLGFLLLDIDDFKQINDTYGHQQGDEVLMALGQLMRDLSRDIDEPARYGGEELAVVLPQTDIDGAELLAERMRVAIEGLRVPRFDGNGEIGVTASFGVAAVPTTAADKASLIAAADAALYRAKRAGKNRVERASPVAA
jgi:diguanylate cyclase (GGDEF)-like protein